MIVQPQFVGLRGRMAQQRRIAHRDPFELQGDVGHQPQRDDQRQRFDEGLRMLRESGEYRRIEQRYRSG